LRQKILEKLRTVRFNSEFNGSYKKSVIVDFDAKSTLMMSKHAILALFFVTACVFLPFFSFRPIFQEIII